MLYFEDKSFLLLQRDTASAYLSCFCNWCVSYCNFVWRWSLTARWQHIFFCSFWWCDVSIQRNDSGKRTLQESTDSCEKSLEIEAVFWPEIFRWFPADSCRIRPEKFPVGILLLLHTPRSKMSYRILSDGFQTDRIVSSWVRIPSLGIWLLYDDRKLWPGQSINLASLAEFEDLQDSLFSKIISKATKNSI